MFLVRRRERHSCLLLFSLAAQTLCVCPMSCYFSSPSTPTYPWLITGSCIGRIGLVVMLWVAPVVGATAAALLHQRPPAAGSCQPSQPTKPVPATPSAPVCDKLRKSRKSRPHLKSVRLSRIPPPCQHDLAHNTIVDTQRVLPPASTSRKQETPFSKHAKPRLQLKNNQSGCPGDRFCFSPAPPPPITITIHHHHVLVRPVPMLNVRLLLLPPSAAYSRPNIVDTKTTSPSRQPEKYVSPVREDKDHHHHQPTQSLVPNKKKTS